MTPSDLLTLASNTPVLFGYSAMEFVGRVISVGESSVKVLGVETGCEFKECRVVEIARLESLHRVTEEVFAFQTRNEPAYKNCKEQELTT